MNQPSQETKYIRRAYLVGTAKLALEAYRRATIGPRMARSETDAAYWLGQHDAMRHLAMRLDAKYPGQFPGAERIDAI